MVQRPKKKKKKMMTVTKEIYKTSVQWFIYLNLINYKGVFKLRIKNGW